MISDPSTVFYIEYYSSLEGSSSADWQQQMSPCPTQYYTPDHGSDGLDSTINFIRPLPSIPDYNPYYTDTAYGLDLYRTFNSTIRMHCIFTRILQNLLQT